MRKALPIALLALAGVLTVAGIGRAQSHNQNDQVLEIAPARPLPPPPQDTAPAPNTSNQAGPQASPGGDDVSVYKNYYGNNGYQPYFERAPRPATPPPVRGAMPYLGVGVKPLTVMASGGALQGLEVLSVDANSPASAAGLRAASNPTSVGASGATAGALLGPAEFLVVPLLRKTGQLGKDGDLIVAADDRRVTTEQDLADELSKLRPGDTLWLTVMRDVSSSRPQSVNIPVRLGQIHEVAGAQ
jgi:hypothetical protein